MPYMNRSQSYGPEDCVSHTGHQQQQQSNEMTGQAAHDEPCCHPEEQHNFNGFLPEDDVPFINKASWPAHPAPDCWEGQDSQNLTQEPLLFQGRQPLWMDQLWDSATAAPLYPPITNTDIVIDGTQEAWNQQLQLPMGPNDLPMLWPDTPHHGEVNDVDTTMGLPGCNSTTYAHQTGLSATPLPMSPTGEQHVTEGDYPTPTDHAAAVTGHLATIAEHHTVDDTPDFTPSSTRKTSNATAADSRANFSPSSTASTTLSTVDSTSPRKEHLPSPTFYKTKPYPTQRRQRNRAAASRCRARTTKKESELEAEEREARSRNEDLRGFAAQLREEMLALRQELVQQASLPACECVLLRRYLRNRARVLCVEEEEDEDETCGGHGKKEEEDFMAAVEDSDGEEGVIIHSPISDLASGDRFGGGGGAQSEKGWKKNKKSTAKMMAEKNIADKGAWGTERIPLVVDFSMAPAAEAHPPESRTVKNVGRHGKKRKSAGMASVVKG